MSDVVGTAVYKISIDTSSLTSQLNSVQSQIENTASSTSSSVASTTSSASSKVSSLTSKLSTGWTVATSLVATATSKAFSFVTSTISSAVSSAVDRVDTLNQFPKIMELFGVSADEASEAIERISDRMTGLPTSLDTAAEAVQSLFLVTQDLGEAEELFYAVNDAAIVFADGSTDAVNNFIYGYKQALSSGQVYAEEFNQMNEAIPGLMDKVAEVIGVTFSELKDGLSDGSISIDQFNEALKVLDSEGVGSMSSLQESAQSASGGIGTSMENMQTAIVRGVASIIQAIGEENIQNAISAIGTAFETLGNIIAGVVTFFQEHELAMDALKAVLIAVALVLTATLIPAIVTTTAALLANPITWIILLVAALVLGIIELVKNFDSIAAAVGTAFSAVGEFFEWVWNIISSVFENIWNALTSVAEFYISVFGAIWDTVSAVFQNIAAFVGSVFDGICTAAQTVWDFLVGVFTPIVEFFSGIFESAWNIVSSVFDSIKQIFQNVADFFTNIWNTVYNTMSTIVGGIADTVSGIFRSVVNGVLATAENIINGPIRAVNLVIDILNAIPGVDISKIDEISLPRMASGGVVEATAGGQAVTLAEGGQDEWVVPESKMASLIDQVNDGTGGSGNVYNIYVNGVFATSAAERRHVAEQIVEAIKQNERMKFAS